MVCSGRTVVCIRSTVCTNPSTPSQTCDHEVSTQINCGVMFCLNNYIPRIVYKYSCGVSPARKWVLVLSFPVSNNVECLVKIGPSLRKQYTLTAFEVSRGPAAHYPLAADGSTACQPSATSPSRNARTKLSRVTEMREYCTAVLSVVHTRRNIPE